MIPGFSAGLVTQGFNIGSLQAPIGSEFTQYGFNSIFAAAIATNQKNLDYLKSELERVVAEDPGSSDVVPDQAPTPVTQGSANIIDWSDLKLCAETSLPLLKTRLAIEIKAEKERSPLEQQMLLQLNYQINAFAGEHGMACGRFMARISNLRMVDTLTNIKFLLAVRNVGPRSRRRFLQTLAGAFSQHVGKDEKELFAYYFLRMSWEAGARGQTSLPEFSELDQELIDDPQTLVTKIKGEYREIEETLELKRPEPSDVFERAKATLRQHREWIVAIVE